MTINSNGIDISQYEGFIELGFGQNWKFVPSIRTFIQNFIDIALGNASGADKISMASSEMIENAIKYSARDDVPITFRLLLARDSDEKQLIIEIQNYASDENVSILNNEVSKITKDSPYEAYLKKVEEIAGRDDGKTMLGLARIRYETECDLYTKIDKSLVTIGAKFSI